MARQIDNTTQNAAQEPPRDPDALGNKCTPRNRLQLTSNITPINTVERILKKEVKRETDEQNLKTLR